jgi:hypothetical protein
MNGSLSAIRLPKAKTTFSYRSTKTVRQQRKSSNDNNRGKQLRDIEGKRGAPFGETVMQNATEGTIKETTYWWPRPGTDNPLEKTALYTKVGDQICSVGYYKE